MDSIKYRIVVAITFLLLLFIPLTLFKDHIQDTIEQYIEDQKRIIKNDLVVEAEDYANDLEPINKLQTIINSVEEKLGIPLSSSGRLGINYSSDPKIFNTNFIPKFRETLLKDYGIKPICVLATDYKYKNFYSFYRKPDLDYLPIGVKAVLPKLLLFGLNTDHRMQEIIRNNLIAKKYFERGYRNQDETIKNSIENGLSQMGIRNAYMRKYFSPSFYANFDNKIIHEFITTKFNSQKIYFYQNIFAKPECCVGGYIAIFTEKDFNFLNTIKIDKKRQNAKYVRRIIACSDKLINSHVETKNCISYIRHIPASLRMVSKERTKNLKIITTAVIKASTYTFLFWSKLTSLIYKFVIMILVFVLVRFILFNSSFKSTIKLRIVLITFVILIIPYIAVGYFTSLIQVLNEKNEKEELINEVKINKIELESFIDDLRLPNLLFSIKAKKDIIAFFKNSISRVVVNPLIDRATSFDVKGQHYAFGSLNKDKANSLRYLKALETIRNLGKLKKYSKKVAKLLKNIAASSIVEIKSSHSAFSTEFQENTDIAGLQDTKKMSMAIFPNPVNTIDIGGIIFFVSKDYIYYPNMFRMIPFENQGVLHFASDKCKTTTAFAYGDNSYSAKFSIYPSYYGVNSPHQTLLRVAMKNKNSGSNFNLNDINKSVSSWSVKRNGRIGLSIISELKQNLYNKFWLSLIPLFLLILVLLSIFIQADVMLIILSKPLEKFIEAVKQLETDNYNIHIALFSVDEFSSLANAINLMAIGLLQRKKMKRFVSDRLFEKIATNSDFQSMQKANVVILSSDIRNFTTISEQNDPSVIVNLLNDYFTDMEKAITENGGIIEKYIGDALIAVFYKETTVYDNCVNAVKSAMAMRKLLNCLNEKRKKQNLFTIENGVGIALGEATVGVIGSKSGRNEFTVFGKVTTLADKLEASTKCLRNSKIAVCSNTRIELHNLFEFVKIESFEEDDAFEVICEA